MKWIWLVLLMVGCASSRKNFKADSVKAGEAAAIGVVKVFYNGKPMKEGCAVCLNSVNGPCQKLEEDGLVFQSLPVGQASVRRIVCHDVSGQHYNIEEATFQNPEGVNYFGEVQLHWTNKGGFKTSQMFGALGAMMDESKNDGKLTMNVTEGDFKSVVAEYESQTGTPKSKVKKSLVKYRLV